MPPSPGNPQSPNQSRQAWLICGLLLGAVCLIYGQTLGHDFIQYDDQVFVRQNRHVTAGLTLDGLHWAFTNGPAGEWYPATMLSHMLDCQLFGLNAGGHQLTNLLLHAAAAIVLFQVWWRMTGQLWPSAFVAGVFAVHPQHVESVAWISERRDVLSGLCFMLTLAAYLGYVRHGWSPGRYGLVALALAVGLMAKAMLVTVPALLLLLDFWPLARLGAAAEKPDWNSGIERPGLAALAIEKIPLFVLAAGDALMTMRTHDHPTVALAWSVRLANAAVSCVTYIAQMFWPLDLAIFYPLPAGGWPAWHVAAAVAILAAVSVAAVVWRRSCPYLFVGWFWFLGMLSPVLGLVQVAAHGMADRYMYLPGIGLSIAVTWGALRLCVGRPVARRLLAGVGGLAIALLAALAVHQAWLWRSDESLWAHAVACTTDNGKAERYLADALAAQHRVDEAIAFYRRAQQHPPDASPFNNLGVLLRGEGRLDEAMAQFRQAVATDPADCLAQMNLGAVLAAQGELDEAMEHLHRAVELQPDYAAARIELAHALAMQKRFDEALVELERAAASDPYSSTAHNDLGTTLFQLGRLDEAIGQFEAALALAPDSAFVHVNLARALTAAGRRAEAIALYRRALQIEPQNADARLGLEKLEGPRAGPRP